MAFPSQTTIQSLKDSDSDPNKDSGPVSSSKGPPPAMPRPRQASDSSIFSTAGKAAQSNSQAGLGAEGGSSSMMGMQGLSMVQRGLQMLNLAFPDNPGLVAVLADLTGRLQSIIPQLVAQQSGGVGMGLFPQAQQAPMPPGPQMGPSIQGAPQPPMQAPPQPPM